MAASKQKVVLVSVMVVATLVFGLGVFFAMGKKKEIADADEKLDRLERDLRVLAAGPELPGSPDVQVAPTEENLSILKQQIAGFETKIADLESSFATPEGYFDEGVDEFNFLPRVQSFVSEMRDRFGTVPGLIEGGQVTLANPREAFGFDLYLGSATTPRDPVQRERIDLERQIIGVLMNELIGSYAGTIGGSLIEVRREAIGGEEGVGVTAGNKQPSANSGVFTLSDLVTASRDGSVNTLGFEVVFEGDTSVLRNFMNRVTNLPFPMRVASVRVTRIREAGDDAGGAAAAEDGLAALFGVPDEAGSDPGEEEDQPAFDDTPIIKDNVSRFSVILEYIEIDLNKAEASEDPVREDAA